MTSIKERATTILCDLIALPTVNPMGRPYRGPAIERPVVEYLEELFSPYAVAMQRMACSDIHESLLVEIPGHTSCPGTLLESHIDTVPAEDWPERAFLPMQDDSKVTGRGACDDKGSLVAMALSLLELLESGAEPPQSIWFLAAGDEEYGQSGIKHFLQTQDLPIGRAIFGEPTECVPIVQHKGTIRWDLTVHGRSAHTSQPALGHNAILDAVRVIAHLNAYERDLQERYTNPLMSGPTLTVTMIHGGRTRNVVPDECTLAIDFRVLPGMDNQVAIDGLFSSLAKLDITITHQDFQCFAPALSTSLEHSFVRCVTSIAENVLQRSVLPAAVPYGIDAGWLSDRAPATVLGPGNINVAHAVDEFVEIQQVLDCTKIYGHILRTDWSST